MEAVSLPGAPLEAPGAVRQYRLSSGLVARMMQLSVVAHPHEACGVLLAPDDGTPTFLLEAQNVATDLTCQFMFDGKTLNKIKRFCYASKGGGTIEAIFHSHPNGRIDLSPADIKDACPGGKPLFPGVVYLVIGMVARPGQDPWMSLSGAIWDEDRQVFRRLRIELV